MNAKTLRHRIFTLHRYIGLVVGLIALVIGLTGSLLVSYPEIRDFQTHQRIGSITAQGEMLPIETLLNAVKPAYANQPQAALQRLYLPTKPTQPVNVMYAIKDNDWIDNYVNPYTGVVLGNSLNPTLGEQLLAKVYELHRSLLAGELGDKIAGIVGLLVSILTITGIALWPGWRKLVAGFKIKWNAYPKRLYFDLHKVAGVVAAVFLIFTFFTGFCWNLREVANPIIYALTFSKQQPTPVSVVVAGQSPLGLTEQLKTAQAALPDGTLRRIYFPTKPEKALMVGFKLPQETEDYGQSRVYLDQYSGKVLRVDSSLKVSLGSRILNSFIPLHFGTFWGLPSRIFYVFVGLAPLILFVTGFVMWWYRHKGKNRPPQTREIVKLTAKN